ncbi:hypothetical protein Tcan_11843, partial [Toxocara canis]
GERYCSVDGVFILLLFDAILLLNIPAELFRFKGICWERNVETEGFHILNEMNSTLVFEFKPNAAQSSNTTVSGGFGCINVALDAFFSTHVVLDRIDGLQFGMRNEILTIALEVFSAFAINIWYTWLLYWRRTPKTITANNLVPPLIIIAGKTCSFTALSSVFWIIITLCYRWPLIWKRRGWQPPLAPINDSRLLATVSIGVVLNWIIFFVLHNSFSRNGNGIAIPMMASKEEDKHK